MALKKIGGRHSPFIGSLHLCQQKEPLGCFYDNAFRDQLVDSAGVS